MSAPAPTLLEARGLTAMRGGRAVLRGIDLAVAAGERVVILGANGSGKSTLLRVLAGLDRADAGTTRGEGIGLVLQQGALFPHLSVLENVALAPKLRGLAEPTARARRALAGIAMRTPCGAITWRIACPRESPSARAASHWIAGTASSPARWTSASYAA